MKYIKPAIITLAVLFIGFLGYQKLSANKAIIDEKAQQQEVKITAIPVTTTTVNSQKVNNELAIIGTFAARKELSIIAEAQGRITSLKVTEGQSIGRGQLIASIDDASIRAQLTTAQASLDKAKKDVERYSNLLSVGAISQTQFEEIQLGMQNQQSNITAIQQQLQYTRVKSPMNGIVSEILLEEGSFTNPGTEIATVVDISQLNMIVMVDERDVVKIKVGQSVNITTDVYPDVIFKGKVNQIGVQADAARKYEIAVELNNNDRQHPLKAGMYGTAIIPTGDNTEKFVLTVPRKSVAGSLKQPQVYVLKDGNIASLKNVEVGETIGDQVVILSGLQEGDQVITTGQINLDDGRQVKVIK
ncbi:MAG: efflux RND transporter periplasmic adaptor subunit [Lewinella sp.]|jgi:RND family efflux transporter MFP subunit|uniref:efflux RND transporter periplasmic adaptor subunit n=1 Tax=Lewinella sp. TaxID=2004506 RepID=UPI003D6A99EC